MNINILIKNDKLNKFLALLSKGCREILIFYCF